MSDGPVQSVTENPQEFLMRTLSKDQWRVVADCLRIETSEAVADLNAQIRDLLEEREELLTEIVRLQRGNHPAGRALDRQLQQVSEIASVTRGNVHALREALTERDAEHVTDVDARDEWVAERYPDALAERPLQDSAVILQRLRTLWEHRRMNGSL